MQEENNKKFEEIADKFLVGKGESSDIVIQNLKSINSLEKSEIIPALNYFASIEKAPRTLLHIVKEIGKHRDKASTSVLTNLLTNYKDDANQYLKVRCIAAGIIGQIKDESAIISLMYVMNDRDENYKLRLAAAEALGKIGNSQAVMPLIGIVSDDEEQSVYLKESATKALGMIGDERAVEPLISILDVQKDIIDKFTYLKEKIVETLGKFNFKQDERLYALKKVLNDKSPHVRASAVEAISEIENDNIVSIIEPMLHDNNEGVAKTTVYAIYTIEGKDGLLRLLKQQDLPSACKDEVFEILDEEDDDEDCE